MYKLKEIFEKERRQEEADDTDGCFQRNCHIILSLVSADAVRTNPDDK